MTRRFTLFILLLCLFAPLTPASADVGEKKTGILWHTILVQGKTIRFPLFVPDIANKDDHLPLVLLAHNETGKNTDTVLKKDKWTDTANRVGFLVAAVGPECANTDGISAVLKAIGEKHPGDKENIYAIRPTASPWSHLTAEFAARGIVTLVAEAGSDSSSLWNTLERMPPVSGVFSLTRLTVDITGLRSDRGQVSLLLFNAADGFPDDSGKAVAQQTVRIENNRASAVFEKLPRGDYGVVLLHDENSNGKLDTSFGFPLEGFGTSNNPRVRMGSPRFSDARFFLSGKGAKRTIVIRMVYL